MKKANAVKYTWCLKGLKWKRWAAIWINSEEKAELVPSHAVIPSPSISHTWRSGNPVGWFDILSSGWLCFPQVHPLQTSATRAHTHAQHQGLFTFPEFMGQWRTGHQGCRKDSEELVQPTWRGLKKQKKQRTGCIQMERDAQARAANRICALWYLNPKEINRSIHKLEWQLNIPTGTF